MLKDATTFFSWRTPNLATVILAINHIDTYFTTMAHDVTKLVSICAAVGLAQKTLNRYYLLTVIIINDPAYARRTD